jgi:hypothetical protein
VELSVGLTVVTLISAGVFSGISQMMLFTTQEEMYQNLRSDLVLTMSNIRRDLHLSTNVVPTVGGKSTGGTTLIMRQPSLDENEEIVEDSFQYVIYSIDPAATGSGTLTGGLVRQVWSGTNSTSPLETEVVNDSILGVGFLYGGQPISQVSNLNTIRDIQIILVSGRETGLILKDGIDISEEDFYELEILQTFMDQGLEFPYLRAFIDYINTFRVEVALSTSMGTATFRNQRVLGLKGEAPPSSS